MNIVIKRYLKTQDITHATMLTRSEEAYNEDIVIVVKKKEGKTGIAISSNFFDENLNLDYCEANNIEVSRSSVEYGEYGNVLSIPEETFAILFPLSKDGITVMKFKNVFIDILSKLGPVIRENNDFIINGKKVIGYWVGTKENQIVAIGSLQSFSESIDRIYTDYFRKNSGKIMPSMRVIGINDLSNESFTMKSFAEAIRESFNKLTDVKIDAVLEIDADIHGGI